MSKINNNTTWWKVGTFAAVIWLLWGRTAAAVSRFRFGLSRVRLDYIDDSITRLRVGISVGNSTYYRAIVRYISATLYLNGVAVATVNQAVNRYVNPNGISVITLIITFDNNNIIQEFIRQLRSGLLDNYILTLAGNISIDNSTYPVVMEILPEDLEALL